MTWLRNKAPLLLSSWAGFAITFTNGTYAANEAKVAPIQGYFADLSEQSRIDPIWRKSVNQSVQAGVIHAKLKHAFAEHLGELNRNTGHHTFTVSFHLTRATSYTVPKTNGTTDVVASMTASLYFTNVLTGEILTTVTDTVIAPATLAQSELAGTGKNARILALFNAANAKLIDELIAQGKKKFAPRTIQAKVSDEFNGLYLLDKGYQAGVQEGDQLDADNGDFMKVIYSSSEYAIGKVVMGSPVKGAVFNRIVNGPPTVKVQPKTVVILESVPQDFSRELIAQLFSEMAGAAAPFKIIQINPRFNDLRNQAIQQSGENGLSNSDTATRNLPEYYIRLRVTEPIVYEAKTNVDFAVIRGYKAYAFADLVDANGIIKASFRGISTIQDEINKGIGPLPPERREVVIKNALNDLAKQLSGLTEVRRERAPITISQTTEIVANTTGKILPTHEKGVVLRQVEMSLNGRKTKIWFPLIETRTEQRQGNQTLLSIVEQYGDKEITPTVSDQFEIDQLGSIPKSGNTFAFCPAPEMQGTVFTPYLAELATSSLGMQAPGFFTIPELGEKIREIVNPSTGFKSNVGWVPPAPSLCIQIAQRVIPANDECNGTACQRPLAITYLYRVRRGPDVVTRQGLDNKIKSRGFDKVNAPDQVERIVSFDLVDSAMKLIDQNAAALKLPD